MNKLYAVVEENQVLVQALPVPGGLLFVTETWTENNNGIQVAVASTFVPMGQDELFSFLKGREL